MVEGVSRCKGGLIAGGGERACGRVEACGEAARYSSQGISSVLPNATQKVFMTLFFTLAILSAC